MSFKATVKAATAHCLDRGATRITVGDDSVVGFLSGVNVESQSDRNDPTLNIDSTDGMTLTLFVPTNQEQARRAAEGLSPATLNLSSESTASEREAMWLRDFMSRIANPPKMRRRPWSSRRRSCNRATS